MALARLVGVALDNLSVPPDTEALALAQRIDSVLPQTQCTRCGYPDCAGYAQAISLGDAGINQCPPGGAEGIQRLARLTGIPVLPLDTAHGREGPRALAVIDETWCIGCTLCIKACPVDCIVGGSKVMHTVLDAQCTGCELCVPACPVDCITMQPITGALTGWAAWSEALADESRHRYAFRQIRVARARNENDERLASKAQHKLSDLQAASGIEDPEALSRKRAVVEAALRRARESKVRVTSTGSDKT